MIKYRVYLTEAERAELEAMVSKGKRKATDMRKAHLQVVFQLWPRQH